MASDGPNLSEAQLIDWLRLARTPGVGPINFQRLINHFGSARAAIDGLPDFSRSRTGVAQPVATLASIEQELGAARRVGARFVARGDAAYPKALAAIDSAPPVIAIVGPLELRQVAMVAIVGARNASAAGMRMAELLARGCGEAGYGVVSGLARGIDTAAHRSSLGSGAIAVLAGGLDKPYPDENRALFHQICERGAVISEMPFGWEPRARDFPRRNRIVSGLSLGTIVIEAARKSGSLITARFTRDQGREVFAVPGSPLDPRAEGPNDLIRDGARLIRSTDDVLDELAAIRGREFSPPHMEESGKTSSPLWDEEAWFAGADGPPQAEVDDNPDGWEEPKSEYQAATAVSVLPHLSYVPVGADELTRATGLSARSLQVALFELESAGTIDRDEVGRVFLKAEQQA